MKRFPVLLLLAALAAVLAGVVYAVRQISGNGGSGARASGGAHPYTIDGVPDTDDFHPSWAPNGREFVYARDYQLHLYDVADGRTRQITHGRPLKRDPAWSPAGTEIAYVATALDTQTVVGGTYSCGLVYTVRPDGSGEHRVSPRGASDCDPAWSPDGTHLTVHGIRANSLRYGCKGTGGPTHLPCPQGSTEGLYVMSARGTRQRPVAYRPNGFESYQWSPDGTKLAFSDFDVSHAYVFDLRSGKVTDIARRIILAHPALDSRLFGDPSWSPDGRLIAVNIGDPTQGPIWYLVRADGSIGHRIHPRSWLPCNATIGNFGAESNCAVIRSPKGNRTLLDKSNTLLLTAPHQHRPIVIARRMETRP